MPRTCEKKVSSDSSPPASNSIARAPSPLVSGRDGTIAAVDGPDRGSMTADIACFVPDADAPPFPLSVNPRRLLYAERRARRQADIHVQPAAAAGRRLRSEEPTSELHSHVRHTLPVFFYKHNMRAP